MKETFSPELAPERRKKLRRTIRHLIDVGERIGARLMSEFERLKREGSPEIFDPNWGFIGPFGSLGENGTPHPVAPIKFALEARSFIQQRAALLPYFTGVRQAYEIGVGPGYLFVMLRDVLGVAMHGCDIHVDKQVVYRELRRALTIEHLVSEFSVAKGVELPLPKGTDAVIAVGPVFELEWGISEHRDFLEMCRTKGVERVFWRFNKYLPDHVRDFYREVGQFPKQGEGRAAQRFCIVTL